MGVDLKQTLTQRRTESGLPTRSAGLVIVTVARASFDTSSRRGERLRRQIEPSSVHAVLDLNNPKVGIKGDLSFEPLLCVA